MLTRDEEHVDERAHDFFKLNYCSGGMKWCWDNFSKGARPTRIVSAGNSQFCAYCGRQALPLQKSLRDNYNYSEKYVVWGYTCVCKSAMDEVEIEGLIKEVQERANKEIRQLKNVLPKTNPDILSEIIDRHIKKVKDSVQSNPDSEFFYGSYLNDIGIKIKRGDEDV